MRCGYRGVPHVPVHLDGQALKGVAWAIAVLSQAGVSNVVCEEVEFVGLTASSPARPEPPDLCAGESLDRAFWV